MKFKTTLIIGISFLAIAALIPSKNQADQETRVLAPVGSFLYYHFSPAVIYNDGIDSTTLEVATKGFDIIAVYVWWGIWGQQGNYLQMYDDGTHGDKLARDRIYTLNNLALPPRYSDFGTFDLYNFPLKIVKTGGQEINFEPKLGTVSSAQTWNSVEADALAVKDFGNGLSATPYAFFIVDTLGEIFPGMPLTKIYCGKENYEAYKKLYSVFPDAFDFDILMPNEGIFDPDNYQENVPYFVPSKNELKNIGIRIFDNTVKFGSAGRLMGVIYHSFDYGGILRHEIGHAWAAKLAESLGICGEDHWIDKSDINGMMSQFIFHNGKAVTLADNHDGTWRVVEQTGGTKLFSPLELYVMGLIPPQDVPNVHLLDDLNFSDPEHVTAGKVTTYSIYQIMAAEGGERVPAYPNTQRSFNGAFIAVSDKPFTNAERDFYSLVSKYFGSREEGIWSATPFYTSTGGRASLNMKLTRQISGQITTSGSNSWAKNKAVAGQGVKGVTITFSNGGGTATTDENGNYSHEIWLGWSGTATPTKAYSTFSPSSRSYSNVNSDQPSQDFLASISKYMLTINIGANGTTNPSPGNYIYDVGTQLTLAAIPNTYYRFDKWTGDASGNDNPITIIMDSDKTIKANFKLIEAPLNLNGQKILNRSLSQAEYINVFTWDPNPKNENIIKYKIYHIEGNNQSLLAEVNSTTFRYQQRKVDKNKVYTYSVMAINNEDREGEPAYVTIR